MPRRKPLYNQDNLSDGTNAINSDKSSNSTNSSNQEKPSDNQEKSSDFRNAIWLALVTGIFSIGGSWLVSYLSLQNEIGKIKGAFDTNLQAYAYEIIRDTSLTNDEETELLTKLFEINKYVNNELYKNSNNTDRDTMYAALREILQVYSKCTLYGTVTEETNGETVGKPISGATVSVIDENYILASTIANDRGEYEVSFIARYIPNREKNTTVNIIASQKNYINDVQNKDWSELSPNGKAPQNMKLKKEY